MIALGFVLLTAGIGVKYAADIRVREFIPGLIAGVGAAFIVVGLVLGQV